MVAAPQNANATLTGRSSSAADSHAGEGANFFTGRVLQPFASDVSEMESAADPLDASAPLISTARGIR